MNFIECTYLSVPFKPDIREYCFPNAFNISCGKDEVIVITSARYGRMNKGFCLTSDYHVGCWADVLYHVDRKCSGRHQCVISIPDTILHQIQPCPKDMLAYLESEYVCQRGQIYIRLYLLIPYWGVYLMYNDVIMCVAWLVWHHICHWMLSPDVVTRCCHRMMSPDVVSTDVVIECCHRMLSPPHRMLPPDVVISCCHRMLSLPRRMLSPDVVIECCHRLTGCRHRISSQDVVLDVVIVANMHMIACIYIYASLVKSHSFTWFDF